MIHFKMRGNEDHASVYQGATSIRCLHSVSKISSVDGPPVSRLTLVSVVAPVASWLFDG